jgi:hypothetical protein
LQELAPKLDRAIDPVWVARQSLEADDRALKPGCGWLPESWLPEAELRRALRNVAQAPQAKLLEYGHPLGYLPLRQALQARLADPGDRRPPSRILLTDGGTQAIDLVHRHPAATRATRCWSTIPAISTSTPTSARIAPSRSPCRAGPMGPIWRSWRSSRRASAEAVPDERSAAEPDRRRPVAGHRASPAATGGGRGFPHRRGRHLRRVPPPVDADPGGHGRAEVRHPSRQLFQDPVGRHTLRLYRGDEATIDALLDLKIATCFGMDQAAAQMVHRLLADGTHRKHADSVRRRLGTGHEPGRAPS